MHVNFVNKFSNRCIYKVALFFVALSSIFVIWNQGQPQNLDKYSPNRGRELSTNRIKMSNSWPKTDHIGRRCDNCCKIKQACDKKQPCSGCQHRAIKCTYSRAIGDLDGSPTKTRCDNCLRQKKGCDRGDPCSGCRHLGINCIYSTSPTIKSRLPRQPKLSVENQDATEEMVYESTPIDSGGDLIICGWTMRQWAELFSHFEVIKMFLRESEGSYYGMDEETYIKKLSDRWTPLHWAALKGYKDIVNLLVGEFRMDVNAKNLYGLTPLHLAAENGKAEVVKQLVSLGAIVESKDIQDRSPLHLAESNGHFDVVRILLCRNNLSQA